MESKGLWRSSGEVVSDISGLGDMCMRIFGLYLDDSRCRRGVRSDGGCDSVKLGEGIGEEAKVEMTASRSFSSAKVGGSAPELTWWSINCGRMARSFGG